MMEHSFIFVSIITTQLLLFADILAQPLPPNIGINYGRLGNNLPAPRDVINLYNRCGVGSIRIYDPNPEVLEALRDSNLRVSVGTRNEDLPSLASSQAAADAWVNTNVAPYSNNVNFNWITIGNEVIPGRHATNVAPAMINIQNALRSIGLTRTKVTTVTSFGIIANSFPPSAGTFTSETTEVMKNVASVLKQTGAPIMLNVYPYFAYASNPAGISLEFVGFNAITPVVDGQFKYFNLFDSMVDAYNVALEKIGAGDVPIVVSETGWPTAGNSPFTSIDNAQVYNINLVNHVKRNGTPRKPSQIMDTFIFALFNENKKPEGIEQNWGLYYPNMSRVYGYLDC
ncbi:putative glucan endo-1,3-beta-glucosidase BG5 [Camellia lanceoleosa]|uniref:Glucan endo-1,3-beta-glucosidase BG5 n=3 Tax=Camellia lanceoleosa TaxID=1840588 RepID=A0ACC0GTZ4_9ERIC|nr:putative glucan endo-1,3-beta-glucosidase BG5 [Camellia lanceoleosa]